MEQSHQSRVRSTTILHGWRAQLTILTGQAAQSDTLLWLVHVSCQPVERLPLHLFGGFQNLQIECEVLARGQQICCRRAQLHRIRRRAVRRGRTNGGQPACRAFERRLGPFETRAEAEHALQKVAERNEKADAEDRAWDEGGR